MESESETQPSNEKVTLESIMVETMDVSQMIGCMHEHLTSIEDRISRVD